MCGEFLTSSSSTTITQAGLRILHKLKRPHQICRRSRTTGQPASGGRHFHCGSGKGCATFAFTPMLENFLAPPAKEDGCELGVWTAFRDPHLQFSAAPPPGTWLPPGSAPRWSCFPRRNSGEFGTRTFSGSSIVLHWRRRCLGRKGAAGSTNSLSLRPLKVTAFRIFPVPTSPPWSSRLGQVSSLSFHRTLGFPPTSPHHSVSVSPLTTWSLWAVIVW